MKTKRLTFLDREGLKNYLFEIQDHIDAKVEDGQDIDDFLDNTDIFDEFEEVLPDEEYPVFVITILNKIRTDYIINRLLDVLENFLSRNAVGHSA
ncbi:MAG: hypothetical protein VX822_00810 [Candidatus Neomarinimicrobiota bacterium]|nr:hypothetical protein [Candidatus Neomarinimicrobiota bacterium]